MRHLATTILALTLAAAARSQTITTQDDVLDADTIPADSIDYNRYLQELRVYGVASKKQNVEIFDKEKFGKELEISNLKSSDANLLGLPGYLLKKLGIINSKKLSHKEKVKEILDNY